jgi:hypothetical protein
LLLKRLPSFVVAPTAAAVGCVEGFMQLQRQLYAGCVEGFMQLQRQLYADATRLQQLHKASASAGVAAA